MAKEKYALLDTDFISKTHRIRKDEQNKLIDRIMEMPEYRFYCHEQIQIELSKCNRGEGPEWLNKRIVSGSIHCISDEQIIDELHAIYSDSAEAMYANMLKQGCDAYQEDYFVNNFKRLNILDYSIVSKESFLQKLKADCDDIGSGNNLGELKSYVLLQALNIKFGEQIYIFCSDDKNARKGIVSLGGAVCINVLSAFMQLNKEGILSKEEAIPYIQIYLEECHKLNQLTFRIHNASNPAQISKVLCEQVIEEMYADKLEILKNGDLKYKLVVANQI